MSQVIEGRDVELANRVAEPQLALFEIDVAHPTSLAGVHTSKRGRRERNGVHRWHTYYAGYAEQFVLDVLDVLGKPGDFVLDPWNGSGTTTLMAEYRGYDALGIEINPVMALHSQAKSLQLPLGAESVRGTGESIVARAEEIAAGDLESPRDELLTWVPVEPAQALLALKTAILEETVEISVPKQAGRVLRASAKGRCFPSNRRGFFLSALFQVLREVGRFRMGSNPTWLMIDEAAPSTRMEVVFERFGETVKRMLWDLERYTHRGSTRGNVWTLTGDSRALEIEDNSIDLVITSPPYCTRIDYVVSTKPELLLMGYGGDEVDGLRRENIGAPVIVDKSIVAEPIWGNKCNKLLKGVARHQSKASRSYYLPLYLQYFRDAELSLREIERVLCPGGKAAIVVQSSYYKELEIPLGEIYVEIAQALGAHAEVGRREVVKQHMAHINTKSSEYARNKVYYEDVVYVEKPTD